MIERIQFFGQDRWTSLIIAAQNGHLDCVELLLDRSADVNAASEVSEGMVHHSFVVFVLFHTALIISSQCLSVRRCVWACPCPSVYKRINHAPPLVGSVCIQLCGGELTCSMLCHKEGLRCALPVLFLCCVCVRARWAGPGPPGCKTERNLV